MDALTQDFALQLARVALGHVEREYPNKPGHVLEGPGDATTPRALHPVFFGSFDWHSCVHGYWLLARVLRRFPDAAGDIAALFERRLTPAAVSGECAYFARPSARGYERPYGWAWLLKVQAELEALPDGRWAAVLRPLADVISERFRRFLPIASYPIRAGTHGNTAFALRMAFDGADEGLRALMRDTAWRWYGADAGWLAQDEPCGDDFLSPALVETECMRRLHPARFDAWRARFMPTLPPVLLAPVEPSDRTDGKIAHLDGLNLSRAWCLRNLGQDGAAAAHLAASLPHVEGDYMGEHWLATYALLALGEAE